MAAELDLGLVLGSNIDDAYRNLVLKILGVSLPSQEFGVAKEKRLVKILWPIAVGNWLRGKH